MIQNTLGQLRLANIATLDALITHFVRLIELTSADEAYISALAQALAPCILRPKQESSLTMNERYAYRLVRDLFAHKEAIFGELKRASSLAHSASSASAAAAASAANNSRARAISTDESNRRANMEERARAIASRSRASSPQPTQRAHMRERSAGGAETRFPVNTSPTERRIAPVTRHSLEVPGAVVESAPVGGRDISTAPLPSASPAPAPAPLTTSPLPTANGTPTAEIAHESPVQAYVSSIEKKNSLGRSAATTGRFPRKHQAGGLARQSLINKRDSQGSLRDGEGVVEEHRPVGVQLEDRPMDD